MLEKCAQKMKGKKSIVIHPFLFAVFPILALYSHNMAELSISEIWAPLGLAFGLALVLLLLLSLVLRDARKAAIIASIFLVLFFSYGYALDVIKAWGIGNIRIGDSAVGTPARYLVLLWTILLVSGAYLTVRIRRGLHNPTRILNAIGVSLVLISSVTIVVYELQRPSITLVNTYSSTPSVATPDTTMHTTEADTLPDIYYIILDAYTGASALEEFCNFDNGQFIDGLSDRGFFVAGQSTCNYRHTYQSIPSSLNMEYISNVADEMGRDATDRTPLHAMMQNHKVWQVLKSRGYKYIHVGSRMEMTKENAYADVNCSPSERYIENFMSYLYQTTILRVVPFDIANIAPDKRWAQREAALEQYECLAQAIDMAKQMEEPVFVFAHVFVPHRPFVFESDGSFLTEEKEAERTATENYVNQLIFVSKEIEPVVDRILSESEVAPIIILQADHGHAGLTNWGVHSILNAYHLPGGGSDLLYDQITPVNSFRVIFDFYLGTSYGLLEDENWSSAHSEPYNLKNVTDVVRRD